MFSWLNRNIIALSFASLFADLSHEMATAVLPAFLLSIGGSAAILGFIEGIADASVSFIKIYSGWYSDKLGKRKSFTALGYFFAMIGIGAYAFATSWYQILCGRLIARVGKGVRDPARDALIVESSKKGYYGRAFGFQRALDTIGAIVGPLFAYILLIHYFSLPTILFWAFIPSIIPVLIIIAFVKNAPIIPQKHFLLESFKELPRSFKQLLIAVGVFNLGKFAISLMILRATQLLSITQGSFSGTKWGILLYVWLSIFYASFSYPVGFFADKLGKKSFLMCGFFLTGIVALGFAYNTNNLIYFGLLFALSGISYAITDGLLKSFAADFLPPHLHGTGYGSLAMIEGVGNFFSSTLVGFLWTNSSPLVGFSYASICCFMGMILLIRVKK